MPDRVPFASLGRPVPCPCGRWVHEEVVTVAAIGPWPVVRKCPRCEKRYLIVWRVTFTRRLQVKFLGIAEIPGGDRGRGINEIQLRRACARINGFNEEDTEFLVTSARLAAGADAATVAGAGPSADDALRVPRARTISPEF